VEDVGTSRTALEVAEESIEAGFGAADEDLHRGAIGQVTDGATQAQGGRFLSDELAEADTLDPAIDDGVKEGWAGKRGVIRLLGAFSFGGQLRAQD
jgi:hypothetical protein